MRLVISFAALLLSISLLQLSSGAIAPLDALAGSNAAFPKHKLGCYVLHIFWDSLLAVGGPHV